MDRTKKVQTLLDSLYEESPAGYAVALHVSFTTPRFLFQAYPKEWMDEYSRRGLVVHDPTVRWGFENDGVIRWSELAEQDTEKVLAAAADFGLKHGLTVATSSGGSKSVASFARNDREFDDDAATTLRQSVEELHSATADIGPDDADVEAELRRLSVRATHG